MEAPGAGDSLGPMLSCASVHIAKDAGNPWAKGTCLFLSCIRQLPDVGQQAGQHVLPNKTNQLCVTGPDTGHQFCLVIPIFTLSAEERSGCCWLNFIWLAFEDSS